MSHAHPGTAMVAKAVVGVPFVWISILVHADLQNSQSLCCKHVCRAHWLLRWLGAPRHAAATNECSHAMGSVNVPYLG